MLPNHAPLIIAEQFGTLASLYPGRIDLGLGRAPGTDQHTAYALRRNLQGDVDGFPRDVTELIAYLDEATTASRCAQYPGTVPESRFGSWVPASMALNSRPCSDSLTPLHPISPHR